MGIGDFEAALEVRAKGSEEATRPRGEVSPLPPVFASGQAGSQLSYLLPSSHPDL